MSDFEKSLNAFLKMNGKEYNFHRVYKPDTIILTKKDLSKTQLQELKRILNWWKK